MRTRAPPVPYQTSFRGKLYLGSLFLQVPVHHYEANFTTKGYRKFKYGTALLNMHAGAGYKAQQDMQDIQVVINLNLGEEPSLLPLTEAQVENHAMGVVFAQQYTLKKGIKNSGIEPRKLLTKSSSKFMIWVHINR